MSSIIWARPLTASEEEYIQQDRYGTKIDFLGPLAIIGPADHPYIHSLNVKLKTRRIYLDGGQYIDEVTGGGPASGGIKIPVVWSSGCGYLLNAASNLGIPYCYHQSAIDLIYFQGKYLEAFIKGFSYADHALAKWNKSLSFFSKCFGATYPDPEGEVAREIVEGVRRILRSAST